MSFRKIGLVLTLLVAALALTAASASAGNRQVPLTGTGSPTTGDAPPSGIGDVTNVEFANTSDEGGVDAYNGIVDRSLSSGVGPGASANSGKKAKSNPELNTTFEGLNFYQQRYSNRGNQFSVEPPDQGMCAGNGYVLEAVNDVLNVYGTSGSSVLLDNTATNVVGGFPRNVNHAVDLNSFYGYPAAINRTTGAYGPELTDPTCIYDAATQRFFLVVLTLDRVGTTSSLSLVNHLDLAVSQTSNPAGAWNVYKIDVTNDGSNIGGSNPGPYLGDYPHIGMDAYGVYLTTNAYPWLANGFGGAQIYALSKAQLAAGAANVNMAHLDTSGMVNLPSDAGSTQPGFTVWPAQSPSAGDFQLSSGGTEYLLSSNAADEATHPVSGTGGNYVSNTIIQWSLKNTSSLDTTPALSLSNRVVNVNRYAIPPRQWQPGSGNPVTPFTPQGYCINDINTVVTTNGVNRATGCWQLLVGPNAHNEVISRPDSNDTRMQQVDYANGKLWGALDTAVSFDSNVANNRAGIAWYVLNPANGLLFKQGTYGVPGASLTYPAIGVTSSGRGVMAFSYTDSATNPSAAYAPIDASAGVGDTHIIKTGANPDDGFTSYKAQVGNPPRTRWGDYGAASVDGNSVWLASELTNRAPACNYFDWLGSFRPGYSGDNLLGTCAGGTFQWTGTAPGVFTGTPGTPGVRAALGNWSTQISKLTP